MVAERLPVQPDLKARLVERAREFRKEPTASEATLWTLLRGGRLGVRFRRQQPIGPFVVDFFCPSHRPIVEVDGPVHAAQPDQDQERQSLLEACGYRVLRFASDEVERDLDLVVSQISAVLRENTLDMESPPRPGRERGLGGEGR
jgi:adenine-specific DNA-methyltransferase